MENAYLDILRDWEEKVADPAIYEHLDVLFPEFSFRRLQQGSPRDHWASRLKMDLTAPRMKNSEKTVVYRSDMRFREQGDWSGGLSVMDRIMADQRLSSVFEAYQYVASRLVLDMPRPDSREVAEAAGRYERRRSLLSTLVDYFSWNLANNSSAKAASVRSYLKSVRGFSPGQVDRLRFGFVPDWGRVMRYVTIDKKFRLEELDEVCGVRSEDGYTAVGKTHTLAIPYVCAGEVKGFIFRRIDDSKAGPKYIASAGLDRKGVFFNMPSVPEDGAIVVVEGELDALKATAEGIPGVVAIGGSEIAGERRRQVEDAFRRGVRRITLCLDLDECKDSPGKGNIQALYGHLMRTIHTIKDVDIDFEDIDVAVFDAPSDPDEYIRGRGADAFGNLLGAAVPYWQFLHEYMSGR